MALYFLEKSVGYNFCMPFEFHHFPHHIKFQDTQKNKKQKTTTTTTTTNNNNVVSQLLFVRAKIKQNAGPLS